jgi:flavin reductase (DIM6/NTAB) family NADH-FMN oxidoreductase RutF
VDPKLRKEILRGLTYGVYVVTARHEERWAGATITWLSQCSRKPPLVMMGVRKGSGLHEVLRGAGTGAVHLLGAGQKEMAADFLQGPSFEKGALNGHPCSMEGPFPVLAEAPGWLGLEVREWVEGGDHEVLVAEVVAVGRPGEELGEPLDLRRTGWSYGG